MTRQEADNIVQSLKARFTWESDGRMDSYHILRKTGPVRGDCDDFAATVLFERAGRSWARFWWLLVSFQACFFLVNSPNGNKHIILWVKGLGFTDNWKDKFTPTVAPHSRPYKWFPFIVPIVWPIVALKLLIGKFDPT